MISTYNFKGQFADDVRSGKKRQTIRARRKNRHHARVGETVRLYTGMRTPGPAELLREAVCESVECVLLDLQRDAVRISSPNGDGSTAIEIITTPERLQEFAQADGFPDWSAMRAWFAETHKTDLFVGVLIKWADIAKEDR